MELIIGCILIVLLLNYVSRNDMRNKKEKANANAMTYSERIAEDINSGITITNCMKQIIISEDGRCDKFSKIAQNLMEMSGLKTPIVSVVTGEGGSGGALALSVADRILMLSSSAYSVVSPEACASILWKDTERANEAAEALKLTAPDLLALGIIDGIVDDRGLSHEEIAGAVMSSAFDAFDTLGQLDDATLTNLRYEKYRAIGQYCTM